MRKIIFVLVYCLCFFILPVKALAENESCGPKVESSSVNVDKNKVEKGSSVIYSARVSKGESDIASVIIEYECMQNETTSEIEMKYNKENDAYEAEILITDDFNFGLYNLKMIKVEDIDGNIYVERNAYYGLVPGICVNYENVMFEVCEDASAPILDVNTIELSTKNIMKNQKLTIKMGVYDKNIVSKAYVIYRKPLSLGKQVIETKLVGDGIYSGDFETSDYGENGDWKIWYIELEDDYGNSNIIYNSEISNEKNTIDLSAGDFSVSGTIFDSQGPVINIESLRWENKRVSRTDINRLYVSVLDQESGVQSVEADIVNTSLDKTIKIKMTSESDSLYCGIISSSEDNDLIGEWEVKSIKATDCVGNIATEENIDNVYFCFYDDDYNLEGVTEISDYDKEVKSTVIDGDLYIGNSALVFLTWYYSTGKIYVMGTAVIENVTAEAIYGWHLVDPAVDSTLDEYEGSVLLKGENHINNIVISSNVTYAIPYKLSNGEAYNIDGKLYLDGITLNTLYLFVNGKQIDIQSFGKFSDYSLDIGDDNVITLEWRLHSSSWLNNKVVYKTTIPVEKYTYNDGVYSKIANRIEPTCLKNGSYEKVDYASLGGTEIKRTTIEIPARGHDWSSEYTIDTKPTCTENGEKSIHCKRCSETKDKEAISALGHNWDAGDIIKVATCEGEGEQSYHCTVCGQDRTETIPATGHVWDENYIVDKAATCTEEGLESIHCQNCEKTKGSRSIAALGHTWNEGEIIKVATCEGEGEQAYHCTVCGQDKIETIPATGHVWNENYTVDKAATCTEDGLKSIHCKKCAKTEHVTVIPMKNHTAVNDPMIDATCKNTGLTKGSHCSVCGQVIVAQKNIAKKAHVYEKTVSKATVSRNGLVTVKCKNCGVVSSKTVVYHPKTVKISRTSFVYNGRKQTPKITVVGADGKTIASSNYTLRYSVGCTKVGIYKVMIAFKGNYNGSITKTFTIVPKKTKLVSMTPKKGNLIIKWARQTAQVTGYQIQYATKSNFAGAKTITVTKNTIVSKTLTKLTLKKKYYVRIRTYKKVSGKNYVSEWSPMKMSVVK